MKNRESRLAERAMHKAAVRACNFILEYARLHPRSIAGCVMVEFEAYKKARKAFMGVPR